jgi:hypothetical protein
MGDSRSTSHNATSTQFPLPPQSSRDDRWDYGSGMTEPCLYPSVVDLATGDSRSRGGPDLCAPGRIVWIYVDFQVSRLILI